MGPYMSDSFSFFVSRVEWGIGKSSRHRSTHFCPAVSVGLDLRTLFVSDST